MLALGPGFLLFTRLAKPDLLKHETRDRIYSHLQASPGVYLKSLRRDLRLPNGVLVHHLYQLERARLIRRRRSGRLLQFYPSHVKLDAIDAIHPLSYALLEMARATPGASQSDVAQRMGVSRQSLNYHVQKLATAGLLRSERRGRETHLRVDPVAWATVARCGRCKGAMRMPAIPPPNVRCPQCGTNLAGAAPAPAG